MTDSTSLTDRRRLTIPAIPESALTPELAAALPEEPAGAPWELAARSLVWWGRAGRGAVDVVPPSIRRGGRTVARIGAFVSYDQTPVGTYDEIIGAVAVQRGAGAVGHIPFIVVDSVPSVLGGRANWLLPKGLATFSGTPAAGMTASGDGWRVHARARTFGPAWPYRGPGAGAFEQEDGYGAVHRTEMGRLDVRARPAIVTVTVEGSPELRSTLPSGRCLGVLLERFDTRLGAATPVAG